MTTAVRELAKRLAKLEEALEAQMTPQLAHSSLEDGKVEEYQQDQLMSVWGRQVDGTHGAIAVAGPKPPTAAGLTLTPIGTGVRFEWDGTWEPIPALLEGEASTPQVAPMNFAHGEVHFSTDPNFTGLFFATKVGEIVSARGGQLDVAVGAGVEVYARLVIRDAAGKASDPSAVVGPVAGGKLSADQVDIDLTDLSGTTIWYDPLDTPPANPHAGDLWLAAPDNVPFRRELDNLGAGHWVEIRDSGVAGALIEAQAAQMAAATKNRTFSQASDPAAALGPDDAGDIWIDTDDGHRLRSWTGTGWTDLLLGTSAFAPNSIVASTVLATGTISGALLSATAIDGKTITGALIRTSDPAVPGGVQRVEISSAGGLQGIDAAGKVLTQVGTDGVLRAVNAIITGQISTAESGARIVVRQETVAATPPYQYGAVQMYNGIAGSQPAQLYTDTITAGRKRVALMFGTGALDPTTGGMQVSMMEKTSFPTSKNTLSVIAEEVVVGGAGSVTKAEQLVVQSNAQLPTNHTSDSGAPPFMVGSAGGYNVAIDNMQIHFRAGNTLLGEVATVQNVQDRIEDFVAPRFSLGVRGGWTGNIAGESPLEYWKIDGIVFIQGSVSNNGDYTPGSTIIPVLSLPDGFRPRGWVLFMAPNQRTSFVYGDISTAGVLRFNRGPLQTAGAVHNISVFFPAA